MALNLQIKNLDKVVAEIKAYPADIEKIINNEFKNFGSQTANEARQRAPVNEGKLKGSIQFTSSNLEVRISAGVDYAGYIEFGTKSFAAAYVATLPAEWQTLAQEVRAGASKGGSFKELVLKIAEWVRHKGLGTGFAGKIGVTGTFSVKSRRRTGSKSLQETQNMQAAYAIALKIVRVGIPAQPFLFPSFEKNKIELIRNLKAQLNAK